jgi:hypothetical protein
MQSGDLTNEGGRPRQGPCLHPPTTGHGASVAFRHRPECSAYCALPAVRRSRGVRSEHMSAASLFGPLSILDNFLSDVVDSISRRDLSLEHARDRLGHAVQRTEDVRQQLEFEAGQSWWDDSFDQMRSWRGKSAFKRADEFFRFGGAYRMHAHTFGDLGEV